MLFWFLLDPKVSSPGQVTLVARMSIPSTVLDQVFIHKLSAITGYTILLYDHLLTLSLEVAFIWDAPWTVVKILFLFSRYWTLIGQTFIMLAETGLISHNSQQFCAAFELFLPFFVIFSGESIRLLVVMRACAILGCKRIVSAVWNFLYVLYAFAVLGVVLWFWNHAGPPHFEYLNETGVCLTPVPPNLWTILFITLTLDSFILVVICYSLRRMTGVSRGVYPSRLIRLLIRDALLFYIATLFNSLLCIVCWTVFSQDPRNVLQQLISVPFIAVMGQRLVLNLRRLRARPNSTHDISREVARQMAAMQKDGEQTDLQSGVGFHLDEVGRERDV